MLCVKVLAGHGMTALHALHDMEAQAAHAPPCVMCLATHTDVEIQCTTCVDTQGSAMTTLSTGKRTASQIAAHVGILTRTVGGYRNRSVAVHNMAGLSQLLLSLALLGHGMHMYSCVQPASLASEAPTVTETVFLRSAYWLTRLSHICGQSHASEQANWVVTAHVSDEIGGRSSQRSCDAARSPSPIQWKRYKLRTLRTSSSLLCVSFALNPPPSEMNRDVLLNPPSPDPHRALVG